MENNINFIANDILIYKGEDIRKYSLRKRREYLYEIRRKIILSKKKLKVKNYTYNYIYNYIDNKIYEYINNKIKGFILTPINCHYNNYRSYKFIFPKYYSINFSCNHIYNSLYDKYSLKSLNNSNHNLILFKGSFNYSFSGYIPLSHYDKNLLHSYCNGTIIKFKWFNNNFIPIYILNNRSDPYSNKKANFMWNLINKPFTIIDFKKIFKDTKPINKMNYETLKMLPMDINSTFYSPITKNTLVRTGIIGDGSCFFHSILFAYFPEYRSLSLENRIKLVTKLRLKIAKKLTLENWKKLGKGTISYLSFQECINKLLNILYNNLDGNIKTNIKGAPRRPKLCSENKFFERLEESFEDFKIIFSIIPLHTLELDLFPKAFDSCQNDSSIDKCKEKILIIFQEYFLKLSSNNKDIFSLQHKFINIISLLIDEAENLSFFDFKNNLSDCSYFNDEYHIEIISDYFNRDLFFIDSKTRMPYKTFCENIKKRLSIIVIWIGQNHYEIVGKLLPGNKIQRTFYNDNPLIKKIYTFLCFPNNIPLFYPELEPYLLQDISL